jgi:hypothetical protein
MRPLALALLLPALSGAAESQVYFAGSQALSLDQAGAGARAMALGSAYVALADDNSALQWNPAGLASIKRAEIGLHHNSWLGGIVQETSDLAFPTHGWGGLGISENYIDYGSIQSRDAFGNPGPGFYSQRLGLGLGWGESFAQDFDLGLSVKAGHEILGDASYNSVSGGLGAIYRPGPGFSFGAAYNNIGDSGSGNDLASGLLLGAAFQKSSGVWEGLASAGFTVEPTGVNRIQLGAEGKFSALSLRAGYLLNFEDNTWGGLNSLSIGCGFKLSSFSIDYAWLPYGDLGNSQRVSLNYAFVSSLPAPPEASLPRLASTEALSPSARTLPYPPGPALVETHDQDSYQVLSEGYVLGQDLEQQGKAREALSAYRLALSGDPGDLPSWRALAHLYVRFGREDYARSCYLQILKLKGSDSEAEQWLKNQMRTANP